MEAEEHLRNGRLDEALAALQTAVRTNPGDAKLRVFLFQLFCVLGQWERALTQLQVLAGLNPDTMMLAQIFRPVIQCEVLRAEVFEGKRSPLIFGQPEQWMGLLVQASDLVAKGQFQAAQGLREKAYEEAPATPGKTGDTAFEWIADSDSRLGPMLEVILEGRYYWVPFCRIRRIVIEKPSDLRDVVWVPAQFVWENGGQVSGHIPARYPSTQDSPDSALRLARRTDWQEKEGGCFLGLGQHMLATDQGEMPLLECRIIDLGPAAAA